MKSLRDHPQVRYGRIVFDFHQNEDEDFKVKSLQRIAKEIRKELNISCLYSNDNAFANPEKGTLLFSYCATHPQKAGELQEKLLAWIDTNAPARILHEEIEAIDF